MAQASDGGTPFHAAVLQDDQKKLKPLLKNVDRAQLEKKDTAGYTALLLAAKQGKWECLAMLQEAGADANSRTTAGESLLHLLASNERLESKGLKVAEKVASKKLCDVNALFNGATALQLACRNLTANTNFVKLATVLVENGADCNAGDKSNCALQGAVVSQNSKLVSLMISKGASCLDLNLRDPGIQDQTQPETDTYKIVKTTLKKVPGGEAKLNFTGQAETITADNATQLPEWLKGEIKKGQLTPEAVGKNWDAFVSIAQFLWKVTASSNGVATSPSGDNKFGVPVDEKTLLDAGEPKKMFKTKEVLGKGGFGVVYASEHSGKKVAVKRISIASPLLKDLAYREIYFLKQVKHENIVTCFGSYLSPEEQEIYVSMELLQGGCISDVATHPSVEFNEGHMAYSAQQMLQGIEYLHRQQICHRDLKAVNILLSTEGQVKLIDFGLATLMKAGPATGMCGSPYWMAPEMILKKPYTYCVDIWSFGISLLELANRKAPESAFQSAFAHMFSVATGVCPGLTKPEKWSPEFKDFMGKCLAWDPNQRATADALLKHPFIKKAATLNDMKKILRAIFLQKTTMTMM